MTQLIDTPSQPDIHKKRGAAIGIWVVFITMFVSFLFINARNIAQPVMVTDLNGIALFSWLIALPAMSGASGTLLFGKLSDMYGRRAILLTSLSFFLSGVIITSLSTTMVFAIAAYTFMSFGHWTIIPLCYSVVGDLFPPAERAKWTGLLNLPSGIASAIGPTLGGLIAESAWGWRGLYWCAAPLILIASILVAIGAPSRSEKVKVNIDFLGTILMVIAASTLIIGFSWLGDPARRGLGIILLFISAVAWTGFIFAEKRAKAPILDPQILTNRTFVTAAGAGSLSFFGQLGITVYSPIFTQDVMGVSPAISGSMLTPFSILLALMGILAGFVLGKTKKYKWIYIVGYTIMTLSMIAMWRLTADTPIWMYVLITSFAALGFGSTFVITTLVAQFAVPKRLLGVAVGAIFFFQMLGIAIAPTILGLVQNSAPDLESGLKQVFLVGAIAVSISLLLILTIPEIPVDHEVD